MVDKGFTRSRFGTLIPDRDGRHSLPGWAGKAAKSCGGGSDLVP